MRVVMLRDSPCAGTSKAASVTVTTRGASLQMETDNIFFQISSDVLPQGLSLAGNLEKNNLCPSMGPNGGSVALGHRD